MPKQNEDVIADSSAAETSAVNIENATALETTETTENQSAAAEETTSIPAEVKEEGKAAKDNRPIENVAWEAKRKIDELYQNLPNMIESAFNKNVEKFKPPETPKYTKAQLRLFAEEMQDAGQKQWAYEEIDKIDKSERQSEINEVVSKQSQKTQDEITRREVMGFISTRFSQCFLKDAQGNFAGWDNSNPLTRQIGVYMQNSKLANDPEGLIAAAKMAAFDLGISPIAENKINRTNAQLKKEQKKTLIAGGGPSQQQSGDAKSKQIMKLSEEYRKTRNPEIFKQLVRARGLNPLAKNE